VFLAGRDIKYAIECGELIVDPRPDHFKAGYDETSIDLHLGPIEKAEVWDISSYVSGGRAHGVRRPELHLGNEFDFDATRTHLMPVPEEDTDDAKQLVFRRGSQVIVRQFGFLLWATAERVGTPLVNPKYICFVDAKSTRARTGIMVHFTAPTIHAGWNGNVTLEITNLGPFDLVLCPKDAIAQLTVADIAGVPDLSLKVGKSATQGQTGAGGAGTASKTTPRTPRRKGT
jgi:dCTP deaminase